MASISFLSFPERIHFTSTFPTLKRAEVPRRSPRWCIKFACGQSEGLQKKVTCNAWLIDISLGLQKDSEKGFTPTVTIYYLDNVLSLLQNIDADNGEVSLAIPDPLISIEQLNSRKKTAVAKLSNTIKGQGKEVFPHLCWHAAGPHTRHGSGLRIGKKRKERENYTAVFANLCAGFKLPTTERSNYASCRWDRSPHSQKCHGQAVEVNRNSLFKRCRASYISFCLLTSYDFLGTVFNVFKGQMHQEPQKWLRHAAPHCDCFV